MPKYAVTVIKRIAYAEMTIIECDNEDEAKDKAIEKLRMRQSPMEYLAKYVDDTHEVGSVVSISA